ncbi:MAG: DNA repair protein RadC [Luteitalea sp.]|nr:DNA repair protein RadC [Luteitalea sp.]
METGTMRLRELRLRYVLKRDHDGQPVMTGRRLGSPPESAAFLIPLLQEEPSEVFVAVFMSTRQRVIAYHEVSRGTIDSTVVHPREVFKAAILANAAALILAHGHPSGDPTPSADDIELTRRLAAAGTLLGIEVLDHLVIGDGRYVSFKELGRL